MSSGTTDLKSFSYLENGEISFSNLDTIKTTKILDPGIYKIYYVEEYPNSRVILSIDMQTELVREREFPDKKKIDILFDAFFNPDVINKIKSLGFFHKTGVLFNGPEGTGKSSLIKHYCNNLMKKHSSIVFYCSAFYFHKQWDVIQKIRKIQNNPIILVLEEFDNYLSEKNYGFMKVVMDGNESIDNCIFMASTNYVDKIPNTLINRPSRFKYVVNVEGVQNPVDVKNILIPLVGDLFEEKEINSFVKELTGRTVDIIKQFCLDKMMDIETYQERKKFLGFIKR